MAVLAYYPLIQAFDSGGDPLSGGKLFTYAAGTSTLKATYQDADEDAANTNPVILDTRGEAVVFLGEGDYKFVLKDSSDNVIWTQDDISSISYIRTVEHKTTDTTLVSSDMDGSKTFTNLGSSSTVTITLPAGAGNYSADFIVSEEQYLRIQATGNDIIRFESLVSSAGGYMQANTTGSSCRLQWNGSQWIVTRLSGTFYDDSGAEWSIVDSDDFIPPTGSEMVGGIAGMELSNNTTDAAHDIDITVGFCKDSGNTDTMKLSAALTKQIDVAWAVDDGVTGYSGGLLDHATEAVIADQGYDVFAILKDSDESVDVAFLKNGNAIATHIPAGYTKYRWIGYVKTDSSADICSFVQAGDYIYTQDADSNIFLTVLYANRADAALDSYQSQSLSDYLPDDRIALVSIAVRCLGTHANTDHVQISQDQVTPLLSAPTHGEYDDLQWGREQGGSVPFIPLIDNQIYYKKTGDYNGFELVVRAVKMKR